METYSDNWNACLLFRNKQLTKQLKNYQEASVLVDCCLLYTSKMQESYRALINNFIIEKQVMLDTIKVELVFF